MAVVFVSSAFPLAGIPAHTLSSFNLNTDYHSPQNEARLADPEHLAAVIEAAPREGIPKPAPPRVPRD
jgi:hypothetical protein